MASVLTAIPTYWRGFKFRSRHEARWAVLFTELCIDFWYEPEGLVLPSGTPYLPDFKLPHLDIWAEVKPERVTPADVVKCSELALASKRDVLILCGPPDFRLYDIVFTRGDEFPTLTDALLDIDYHGRRLYERERRLFCSVGSGFNREEHFSQQYRDAVYLARGYRFEDAA